MATIKGYSPTHPGEVIKDEIDYRGISQVELAKQMGISYKVLNDILNCRRPLTTNTAMLFEAALDIPADALMRLQMNYNVFVANQDNSFVVRIRMIRENAQQHGFIPRLCDAVTTNC